MVNKLYSAKYILVINSFKYRKKEQCMITSFVVTHGTTRIHLSPTY
jgi:hypothetical protein